MIKMISLNKRSPLKAAPLRTAGQSIEEEILRITSEDVAAYVSFSVFMAGFALYEWYRWLRGFPPQPMSFSIGAVIMIAYCAYKFLSAKRKLQNILNMNLE